MMQNIITLEIIRDVRENYNENLWVNPRTITPENRRKCMHCDMVTTASNLKRWHDDACKHRILT